MPRCTGIAIIDTNCLKFLESPEERRLVTASLATADFDLWPTAINAVEAAKSKNQYVRDRVLTVLDALAEGKGLLPLPKQLLQRATDAIRDGYDAFSGPMDLLRLKDRTSLSPEFCAAAQNWSDTLEEQFNAPLNTVRSQVQALIRAKPEQAPWATASTFLDQFWTTASQQDTLLQGFWESFGHTGQAPIEKMVPDPMWRMFLDLQGVAVFERAIEHEQPKRVDCADLLQLLYLTLRPRRILVTAEGPLFRAAKAVLDDRYSQAQILTWDEFRRCI